MLKQFSLVDSSDHESLCKVLESKFTLEVESD